MKNNFNNISLEFEVPTHLKVSYRERRLITVNKCKRALFWAKCMQYLMVLTNMDKMYLIQKIGIKLLMMKHPSCFHDLFSL